MLNNIIYLDDYRRPSVSYVERDKAAQPVVVSEPKTTYYGRSIRQIIKADLKRFTDYYFG